MRTFASILLVLGLAAGAVACDTVDADDPVIELRARTPDYCGGFAGLTCPGNQSCIDDPSDDCDPANGGADCIGICVGNGGGGPNDNANCHATDEPGTHYVANSPEECAAILFLCGEGYEQFFNECGCGCTPV